MAVFMKCKTGRLVTNARKWYIYTMKKPTSTEDALRIVETFDILPDEKRVAIFRQLSAQAREELIEVVARPGDVTRRISEEEMFFTIKG